MKQTKIERTNRTLAVFCWLAQFEVKFSRVTGIINDRTYKNITDASQQRLRHLVTHSRTKPVHATINFSESTPLVTIWNESLG